MQSTEILLGKTPLRDVKKLKASEDDGSKVHSSANMVQTLFKHDLVDELCLMIFPTILGTGKRLFAEGLIPTAFELMDHLVTSRGIYSLITSG
jgi:dihydrofolate reductase